MPIIEDFLSLFKVSHQTENTGCTCQCNCEVGASQLIVTAAIIAVACWIFFALGRKTSPVVVGHRVTPLRRDSLIDLSPGPSTPLLPEF